MGISLGGNANSTFAHFFRPQVAADTPTSQTDGKGNENMTSVREVAQFTLLLNKIVCGDDSAFSVSMVDFFFV